MNSRMLKIINNSKNVVSYKFKKIKRKYLNVNLGIILDFKLSYQLNFEDNLRINRTCSVDDYSINIILSEDNRGKLILFNKPFSKSSTYLVTERLFVDYKLFIVWKSVFFSSNVLKGMYAVGFYICWINDRSYIFYSKKFSSNLLDMYYQYEV